jgi:hypothetical protein
MVARGTEADGGKHGHTISLSPTTNSSENGFFSQRRKDAKEKNGQTNAPQQADRKTDHQGGVDAPTMEAEQEKGRETGSR